MKRFAILLPMLFLTSLSLFSLENSIPELEALTGKYRDYRIFYNLGALYAEQGDTGKAVLNFKRAGILNPSYKETREGLSHLRRSAGVPSYYFDLSPIEKAVLLPISVFSLNAGFLFGFIIFILGSAGLSLVFLRIPGLLPENLLRKILISAAVFCAAGIFYISASFVRYQVMFNRQNAVITENAALLERPDPAGLAIAEISAGMECDIKKDSRGYYLLKTIDGREGWMAKNQVRKLWEGI